MAEDQLCLLMYLTVVFPYEGWNVIVKYIINHSQSLAIFRANHKHELLKVAKTMFVLHYIIFKLLLVYWEGFATIVVLHTCKTMDYLRRRKHKKNEVLLQKQLARGIFGRKLKCG